MLGVAAVASVLWATGVFAPSKAGRESATDGVRDGEARLTGELFAATKDGEVRKLGGQTLTLVPVTPEFRDRVRACLGRMKGLDADRAAFRTGLDAKYPDPVAAGRAAEWDRYLDGYTRKWRPIVSDFHTALNPGRREVQTNSDGRFEVKVAPGKYVLYTPDITVKDQRLAWGEVVDAPADTAVSLGPKSAMVITGAWQDQLLYRLESPLGVFVDPTPVPPAPVVTTVRDLVKALDGPDAGSRRAAIKALAELGPEARDGVDALAGCLADAALRLDAADALGRIGTPARRAVPTLYLKLKDSPEGSAVLANVLPAIDPDAGQLYRRQRELELDARAKRSTVDLLQARRDTARASGNAATVNDLNKQIASVTQEIADRLAEVAGITAALSLWGQPKVAPVAPTPAQGVAPPPPPGKERKRAGLLAELDARENAVLTELEEKYAKNKDVVRRLRAAEQALLGTRGYGDPSDEKYATAHAAFRKDQDETVARVNRDTAVHRRKQEEFEQARRRIVVAEPDPTDPRYIDQDGLLLTEKELDQVGRFRREFPTPRAAAEAHVKALAGAKAITSPTFVATWGDPEDKGLAAVSYGVSGYRGKAARDQTVHVFVVETRGYWVVLELPGRPDSVLLGSPAPTYKRVGTRGEGRGDPFERRN
ncbi:MAG TPA: hypothetical protein VH092_06910 [Urbifossiella sp.]|jgi:hypothetical protein|nr:hypothetical protein [Urbifossiella sp.]